MDVKNNPAGRLHDVLSAAQNHNKDLATKAVWADVFGIPADDTGLLLQMIADVIDLMRQTKAAIERLDDVDHELYLQPLRNIELLFSHINFEAAWHASKDRLDPTTMYGLRVAADKLSRVTGYSHVDNSELDALRRDLDVLLEEALRVDMPTELKMLFIRNLESLRQALLAYRVRGIDGLQHEIERTFGSLMLHKKQVIDAVEKGGAQGSMLTRFFELADRLNKLVSLAKNSKDLAAPAVPALLDLLK